MQHWITGLRPVGSDKYLVFNQHQQSSHRAHAHKLLDCSHIHQQHSTASTAQPARISSELSARRRLQSKESTSAMISEESYKLRVTSNRAWDMFIKVTKVTKVLFKYLILVVPSCSFLVDQSVLFPPTGHGLFHTCSPSRIHLLLTHLMPTEVGHEPCLNIRFLESNLGRNYVYKSLTYEGLR